MVITFVSENCLSFFFLGDVSEVYLEMKLPSVFGRVCVCVYMCTNRKTHDSVKC